MHDDLKAAHAHATMAIADLLKVAFAKLTDEQIAQMREHTKDGTGRVTIAATLHNGNVHVELAIAPPRDAIFDNALVRLDGAAEVAFATPEAVQVVDHNSLN